MRKGRLLASAALAAALLVAPVAFAADKTPLKYAPTGPGGTNVVAAMQTGDTVGVPHGGTGAVSFTSNCVLIGAGTSAVTVSCGASTGYVLTWNASGPPTFQAPSGGCTTFICLSDVPGSYSGAGLKLVRVNTGATALEFVSPGYFALGTDASHLTGTLPAAVCPLPTGSTVGCIESYTAVTHQFINAISTGGVPSSAQPAFTDISGSASAAQMATNLSAAIDSAIGSTRGAVLERGASGWALVAPSSTVGYALISNGTGADPTYQAVGGSGGTSNPFPIGPAQVGFGAGTPPITTFCPNSAGEGSICGSTTLGFIYSMWAPPTLAPARVQEVQANNSLSITFGSAPTVGNYMIAACAIGSFTGTPAVPAASTGWTSYSTTTGVIHRYPSVNVVYRLVQTGDTAAETPCTGSGSVLANSAIEVSGLDPGSIANSIESATFATFANNSDTTFTLTQTYTTTNNNDFSVTLADVVVGGGGSTYGTVSLTSGWSHTAITGSGGSAGGVVGSQAVATSGTLVTSSVNVVDTATQMSGGGATSFLMTFKSPTINGWQQLSYFTTFKNAGTTITSNARSLNCSTGLTCTDDGHGNETITASGSSGVTSVATDNTYVCGGTITTTGTISGCPAVKAAVTSTIMSSFGGL